LGVLRRKESKLGAIGTKCHAKDLLPPVPRLLGGVFPDDKIFRQLYSVLLMGAEALSVEIRIKGGACAIG
jgi:hypothetical protein